MGNNVTLRIMKADPRAEIHGYKHEGDMCFDMGILIDGNANIPKLLDGNPSIETSVDEGKVTISSGSTVLFHTGLKFEPDNGYGVKVHVRSSTGIKKRLILSNSTGIIDNAYRGEVMVAVTNIGRFPVEVLDGERLVQCEVVPIIKANIEVVDSLSDTERGTGGIGSTGGH